MEELQHRILELRNERGLTQKQLAKEIGVSMSAISFWETGVNEPKASYLVKLSNFFGVTTEYLLGMEDEFGTPTFTAEERAAGISETRRENITPIEDDMLYVFRNIGKKFGEQAQRDYITVGENMLKLK